MKPYTNFRPWGHEVRFTHNEKSTVKLLVVKPGQILSYQSHKHRKEYWYVIEGKPWIMLNDKAKTYKPGDEIRVRLGMKHRIGNKTKKLVRILEIAFGKFDQNDIIRYDDKYGRNKK